MFRYHPPSQLLVLPLWIRQPPEVTLRTPGSGSIRAELHMPTLTPSVSVGCAASTWAGSAAASLVWSWRVLATCSMSWCPGTWTSWPLKVCDLLDHCAGSPCWRGTFTGCTCRTASCSQVSSRCAAAAAAAATTPLATLLSFAEGSQHFLSVLHATEESVDFITPRHVTQDHVVIDVPGFSCFGLVTSRSNTSAIAGLVLVFWEKTERSLFVLLLPRNICLIQVHTLIHPILTPPAPPPPSRRTYSCSC